MVKGYLWILQVLLAKFTESFDDAFGVLEFIFIIKFIIYFFNMIL